MMFSPSVDVKETDNEVRVDVEVPGLTEKDVEVTVTPEALSIRGEKREERTEEQKERGYLLERSYGTFERRIPIPSEIDQEKVQANFDRGVLTIHLPKTAASQSRAKKIQITCGEGAKKARPDGGQPSQRM
jgi:HSP20 family protein